MDFVIETAKNPVFQKWFAIVVFIYGVLKLLRNYVQGGQYTDPIRIDGKIVVITGGNAGIGKATAIELAKRGAKIYLACRDKSRAENACHEITKISKNTNVYYLNLDLASFDSIRKFVKNFSSLENRLDILVNNAGIMGLPQSKTVDGFEMHFGVNHLGPFLLTNLMLNQLKKSNFGRIINVSSMVYTMTGINRDDVNHEQSYNSYKCYAQSKLANILFTRELAKRLKDTNIVVNTLHPGVVITEIARHFRVLGKLIVSPILAPILHCVAKTIESGAQTSVYLAVAPEIILKRVTGEYFCDCKKKKLESADAVDDELAEWLWKKSAEWTKL